MFVLLLLGCVYENFLALGEGEATLRFEPLEGGFEEVVWEASSSPLPEDASSWWDQEPDSEEVLAVMREEHAFGHYQWFGGGDARAFQLWMRGEEGGGAQLVLVWDPDQPGDPLLFGEFMFSAEQDAGWLSAREDVEGAPLRESGLLEVDPFLPAQGDVRFEVVETAYDTPAQVSLSWDFPEYVETRVR